MAAQEREADARGSLGYFSGLASAYADHRPSYPLMAIDAAIRGLPRPVSVADIGCGTGISTRLIAIAADQIIGIDPNQDMLDQALTDGPADERIASRIRYQRGTAEVTGLSPHCVDLIICAQSFHWFDAVAALAEFHRVLRPGGRLALIWNVRDPANAFTAAYEAVSDRAMLDAASRGLIVGERRNGDLTIGGLFIEAGRFEIPNPQRLNLEGVLGRAHSASYYPRDRPLRDELDDRLREAYFENQREGFVTLMHRTEVTLGSRVDPPTV